VLKKTLTLWKHFTEFEGRYHEELARKEINSNKEFGAVLDEEKCEVGHQVQQWCCGSEYQF
jgi:hypothetical protein